jgi:hypothetical protein
LGICRFAFKIKKRWLVYTSYDESYECYSELSFSDIFLEFYPKEDFSESID